MSPRAVGTATIAFGLVNIPIKLYSSANPSSSISFKYLSKEGHRLKQQYIDPKNDDVVVSRSEMVKGYEFSKDRYVIFSDQELKALQEKATQTLEISEFIPVEMVPAEYYQKTYYLGPDKHGDRAYRLLAEAMKQTGRVALAKYAARGKMYLVMISPKEDGLVMHQLHYPDELTSFSEVPKGDSELKEGELPLALQLIQQIASDRFDPRRYEDEVRMRIETAIQKKIDGEEITEAPAEAPRAQIIDIMEALKKSLNMDAAEPDTSKAASPDKKTSGGDAG